MKTRKYFILAISFLLIAFETNAQTIQANSTTRTTEQAKELVQGTWYSPDWEYGFNISNFTGRITDWHNTYNPKDKNGKGDVALNIEGYSDSGFTAKHLFYDGSWIDVRAIIINDNTLQLTGRREVWIMKRQE